MLTVFIKPYHCDMPDDATVVSDEAAAVTRSSHVTPKSMADLSKCPWRSEYSLRESEVLLGKTDAIAICASVVRRSMRMLLSPLISGATFHLAEARLI
jgi:hypothetical protein